jgi:hypothetical protein
MWADKKEVYDWTTQVYQGNYYCTRTDQAEQYIYNTKMQLIQRNIREKYAYTETTYAYHANGKLKKMTEKENRGGITTKTYDFNDKGYKIKKRFDFVYGDQKPQDPDFDDWKYITDTKGMIQRVDWIENGTYKKDKLREKYIFEWRF